MSGTHRPGRMAKTKRADGTPHWLCSYNCSVDHVETCETCFGFGLRVNTTDPEGISPFSAASARQIREGQRTEEWKRCPECNGTPCGVGDDDGRK